ncbi:DNA cytosine methyltransferase [Massilia violaceinigra]|uniref:Cytosine-specific methyltransferase n=1 Tax=Massilia violaceinigra TaxID=2045208 RepID=A0ABY4A7W1_9BURK|nr:DNA cytosine methyltransferase [Massilia violaceinigra]UOD30872.1 DNA cytosine methyltransferase [Massilia violaceinigra]
MNLSKKNEKRRPVGIDLFSGAGGLSLGFEQAGFDIAAAVEIDPVHCAVHEYNFPITKTICASVADITGDQIRQRANLGDLDIDVVFGGAPCQGFSLIGKRVLHDPRNQLVFHYVRLINELKPKYFVFENVKGLTVGKHAHFLTELIRTLGETGYHVLTPYQVLNAADYGVPQDRQRLFLIGARHGFSLPEYPEKLDRNITVWEGIGDLPNADDFAELLISDSVRTEWTTAAEYGLQLRGLVAEPKNYGYNRLFDVHALTSSLRTEHTKTIQSRFLSTDQGRTEEISRFRKLAPGGLCNTLRAGTDSARGAFTSARPIHPIYPRVITVREAARLHSYPDWFRFHSTKWHGFRQIGNSVPPLLGRAVASQIIKALQVTPSKPDAILYSGNSKLLSYDMSEASKIFCVPYTTIARRQRTVPHINSETAAL